MDSLARTATSLPQPSSRGITFFHGRPYSFLNLYHLLHRSPIFFSAFIKMSCFLLAELNFSLQFVSKYFLLTETEMQSHILHAIKKPTITRD